MNPQITNEYQGEMQVQAIFHIGQKTILAITPPPNGHCFDRSQMALIFNGQEITRIFIEGWVHGGSNFRDVWTQDAVPLSDADLVGNELVLRGIHSSV